MNISDIKKELPQRVFESLKKRQFETFLPAQEKAIKAGLLKDKTNILVCTPTASGKTLIAELVSMKAIYEGVGKAIYIVPLKALATEKYKEFKELYKDLTITVSIGDTEVSDSRLAHSDFIITTSEKLDSEIRHDASWLKAVKVVIVDEIHLMNDPKRGPTLEILLTILKEMLKNVKIIGLSATIGNPSELANWLNATLVIDTWRPVTLKKGIYLDENVEFYEEEKLQP